MRETGCLGSWRGWEAGAVPAAPRNKEDARRLGWPQGAGCGCAPVSQQSPPAVLFLHPLACSAQHGGYSFVVTYTQAGLMSLKGLAAGEAGGGDGVGRFRQDSRALRIGRAENWPSEG